MSAPQSCRPPAASRGELLAALLLTVSIVACAVYANLSFAITHGANYRYFPPFEPNVNANLNTHLGGEYFNIARALAAGEGFAHPFDQPTGPTAWQPPVLPLLLAGLLTITGGDLVVVTVVVVTLQVFVLIGTGLLVLALVRCTATPIRAEVAATVYLLALLGSFWWCFQYTHDGWLVLLAVDLLLAGSCWGRPLRSWPIAAAWGLFGGLSALVNPGVGLTWGLLSLLTGYRERAWRCLIVAALVAGLAIMPWALRNYLVLGRWVPLKSNLAYELFQTHCLQTDGLLQSRTFRLHPYHAHTPERREYNLLGEVAYLERKWEQFAQAVRADPMDFLDRVASRLLGATLWYVPFRRDEGVSRPWLFWASRLTHPLPFLALLVLFLTSFWQPLHRAQGIVMGVYLFYLLPYIGASYYERYALPLLGVKVLLVLWAAERLLSVFGLLNSSPVRAK